MHIKTIRHKNNTIKTLLQYMVDGMENSDNDLLIAHNLPGLSIKAMTHAYLSNDSYRQAPAKVRHYHEILSFSERDTEHLSKEKLEQITQQYIQMRNPNALCFAVAHMNTPHIHVHLCFSGTEFRSRKTLRMDDKTFKNLREGMEMYQQQYFPELQHSTVYLNKEKRLNRAVSRDQNARIEKEYQRNRRITNLSEKEELMHLVSDAYDRATNLSSFHENIEQHGLELSSRNGAINGVKGKRRYRFSTLGITREMLLNLDKLEKRHQALEAMKLPKEDFEIEL